jgi:aryl-alcohol dehydrogenase-like predicted oxidoreductase
MKIGLGTAQFGLDYGISNPLGKTPVAEVRRILDATAENGVHVIDTASLYGDSEKILGQCLGEHHSFHIITKTPQYNKSLINEENAEQLKKVFHESLARLKQSSLYGLLVHSADDLLAQGAALVLNSLHVLQGGEIFVPKIPSMRITDLARVIAPDARTLEVGIRPGEKVHEIMITADDARETVELNEVYVIQPTLSFWSYRKKH